MANQYHQQEQYYQSDWYEERERYEQGDHARAAYIRGRPSTFSEHYEEVIEEPLQEMYDWEMMHLKEHPEQEQSYELEGIAALEQLFLLQDQMEQTYQLQTTQPFEEEKRQIKEQAS